MSPFPPPPAQLAPAAAAVRPTFGPGACPAQVLYASTNSGVIYRIDDHATAPTAVLLFDTGLPLLSDVAVEPASGDLHGWYFGKGTDSDLYRIDAVTGTPALIGNYDIGPRTALEISHTGVMYSFGHDQNVYVVDYVNPGWTIVGGAGDASSGDLATDVCGKLFATIWRVTVASMILMDPWTGAATFLGSPNLTDLLLGVEIDCDGTTSIATRFDEVRDVDLSTMTTTLLGDIGIPERVFGLATRCSASRRPA